MNGALELHGEAAIRRHELEAAVAAGHRAHGNESIAGATRQPIDQRLVLARLVGGAQVFAGRAMAQVYLARGDFMPVDEAPIESQVVDTAHASAQHCGLAVHGEAAGADPVLCLAA